MVDLRRKAAGAQEQAASGNFVMSGIRLGRSELAVRASLTNGTLDKGDVQLLRNFLKQVGGTIFIRSLCWWFADSNSSDVVGTFLTAADHHGDGFLQVS